MWGRRHIAVLAFWYVLIVVEVDAWDGDHTAALVAVALAGAFWLGLGGIERRPPSSPPAGPARPGAA